MTRNWPSQQSAGDFIAFHLERGGKLAEKIVANANTIVMVQHKMKSQKDFPDTPDLDLWACLKNFDPDAAEALASEITADKASAIKEEIATRPSPTSANGILQYYWRRRAAGKTAEAETVYLEALKLGPMLPPL
ncbi:MAG: hypothetical protein ACI9UA_005748 [Pseudoalteromonas tetraodonis]|jgi:hypothetical protein